MCGVIGYSGPSNKGLIRSLFKENNIRGQHATGISWVEGGSVQTFIHPGPAEEFLEVVPDSALDAECLIGHSRYSTSSLDYNQPISNSSIAVAHNGVVSQSPPSEWQQEFGFRCETANDSELLLHSWGTPTHPLSFFPEASIGACLLDGSSLVFFRNGKRPLWYWEGDHYIIVVSARDILKRVIESDPRKCDPYVEYRCAGTSLSQYAVEPPDVKRDLQYGSL